MMGTTVLHKRSCLVALSALALTAAPTWAASDTVDATAQLEKEALPLIVSAKTALSFGTINVPNGSEPGHKCRYNLAIFGETGAHALAEVNDGGTVVDTTAPTASACDWGSSGVPATEYGRFQVDCNPASEVTYSASFASDGIGGGTLAPAWTGSRMAAFTTGTSTTLEASQTTSMTHACPVSGAVDIGLGASISVEETAKVTDAEISVGTITLEASY